MGNVNNTITLLRGCPDCKKINERENKRIPFATLLQQFNKHFPLFTYDESSYTNATTQMIGRCPDHGKFDIIPRLHALGKQDCPDCTEIKRQQLWVETFKIKASKKHGGFYTYDDVVCGKPHIGVLITCPTHGTFSQRPGDHLRGHGCKACVNGSVSRKQIFWTMQVAERDNITIEHAGNVGEYLIPGTRFKADGFCRDTNTVYEFHGDAFHGNPELFKPSDKCHPFDKNITAGELLLTTKKKEDTIRQAGFNLVVMWEHDFNKLYPDFTPSMVTIPLLGTTLNYNRDIPHDELKAIHIVLKDKKFKGFRHNHNYICKLCGNGFISTLTQRKQAFRKYNATGCPKCSSRSLSNNDILVEIQETVGGTITNNILHMTDTIAVMIQGLQENSKYSSTRLQQYHTDIGIQLIIIFMDEWINNNQLILDKLMHYSGHNYYKQIYGRKCTIHKITGKEKSKFLNDHHVQGNDAAMMSYGAFHEDELVAVMTFTKPRVALGYKDKDRTKYDLTWELSRFATNTKYRVPGIASKLLAHFKRTNQWNTIISYADRRWSVGNMYDKLGFVLTVKNPPNYHYIIDGKRKHRWNFRKDILKNTLPHYDKQLTEYQNMQNDGKWRVWDCGTLRYVLERPQ